MTVRHMMAIVSLTSGAVLLGASAATPAAAAQSFTCVSSDADTCVVTIPLTSNMNETVTSTMPDTQPWFLSESGGDGTVNPSYTLTNDACGGDFDGGCGSTQGHVWTATLTTDVIAPGGDAVLTFVHVTSSPTAKLYHSLTWSTPNTAFRHQPVTITGNAKPKPAKGHLVLQRRIGGSWKRVETLVYKAKIHAFSTTFTWTAAKHATVTYRLEATAAPGLLATPGGAFKIKTAS